MDEKDSKFEEYAKLIKSIGDTNRIKILNSLSKKEKSVKQIMEELKLTQPLISHHLKFLKYAGLINNRKEGVYVYYSLVSPAVTSLIECIIVCCDQVINFKQGKIKAIKPYCVECEK
jgi:ArsR family transcriptional regulator